MQQAAFRQVVATHLVPLLSAVLSPDTDTASPREAVVAYVTPCRLKLRPYETSPYKVFVDRSQEFTPTELRLVRTFLRELRAVAQFENAGYMRDVLAALPRRLIVNHLKGTKALARVLEQMELWSSQTYEGQRITSAIGVAPRAGTIQLGVKDFLVQPFAPVVGDGIETLLVCGTNGKLIDLLPLADCNPSRRAPLRFARVAGWTSSEGPAAVLNRHGEILVFSNGALRFSRRRGTWLHYAHDPIVKRMWPPMLTALRRAMYESCLDVSFARTGGCLGVVAGGRQGGVTDLLDRVDDFRRPQSPKARLFSAILSSPFQGLDRRVRQEILALDGATILDHLGNILSVGAIVHVPAGSEAGGREAAAKKLSTLGLGIKISADGPITGFRNRDVIFSVS